MRAKHKLCICRFVSVFNSSTPSAAQLSSLATLPPADRQLREPTLLSKRATVEAWLTREANTLQKYRLVRLSLEENTTTNS